MIGLGLGRKLLKEERELRRDRLLAGIVQKTFFFGPDLLRYFMFRGNHEPLLTP